MLDNPSNKGSVSGYCCLRFPVTDLRRSVDFYCNVLGYALTSADYSFGEAHVSLTNGNGPSVFLMETKPEDVTPLKFVYPRSFWITNGARQVTMIEMLTDDLIAMHERIQEAGGYIEKEPVFTKEFGYFTFYDPDGHYFRMVEETIECAGIQT